jgi:hypothetical protein
MSIFIARRRPSILRQGVDTEPGWGSNGKTKADSRERLIDRWWTGSAGETAQGKEIKQRKIQQKKKKQKKQKKRRRRRNSPEP